ncbi:MAG: hypothetical protein H7138_06620, partial [Myxococcales bacterium]|nr:hypothetical protein [Myxococcales bacterium]
MKRQSSIAGTCGALPADMYDADDIEAINFEQLATATDRLLLRGAVADRARRRRHAAPPVARDIYPRMVS